MTKVSQCLLVGNMFCSLSYYISVQEICWNKEQYIFDIRSLMRSKICILTPKNLLL